QLLVKMGTTPAPPLASVAPGAPPGVCRVVDRALQFEREQRYPDAATMQRDVQALRSGALAPPPAASARHAGARTAAAAPNALPAPPAPAAAVRAVSWNAAAAVDTTRLAVATRSDFDAKKWIALAVSLFVAALFLLGLIVLIRGAGGGAET